MRVKQPFIMISIVTDVMVSNLVDLMKNKQDKSLELHLKLYH